MTFTNDDRTAEQRTTHRLAWVGTDPFMSHWGGATDGASYAAWAFPAEFDNVAESYVRSRRDMQRVRLVNLDTYRPGRGCAHFHIYVWTPKNRSHIG